MRDVAKKISPELKAGAVRIVAEHQEDYPSVTAGTQGGGRTVPSQLRKGAG